MRIAVTGGTGRIGGRVVRLLAGTSRHDVTALSSRTAPYDDPAALRAALLGVDTLVFVSSDGEAARVVVHHHNILDAVTDSAVRHVVFLSGLDAALDSPFCYAFTNGDTEQRLRASGRPYSIIRSGLFAEFLLGLVHRAAAARRDGTAALPATDAPVSPVAKEDVARCLAALALGDPTNGHHDVTGPDSLRLDEIAAAAGYRFAGVTPQQFASTLLRAGETPWWTYAYTSLFAAIDQRRWQATSGAVTRLSGRPAIPLTQLVPRPVQPITETARRQRGAGPPTVRSST
jgi:NAD(P)H dehydrogenase (quinone)